MPRCPNKHLDKDGRPMYVPLKLAAYPQAGTKDGLLFGWFCDICGYDSSRTAHPTQPW